MNADPPPSRAQSRSIIRGSLVSLGARLLDLPSRYGFHLLVAAELGIIDTGRFYIVFSIVTTLAGFGRLGMDQALTRQIAMDMASGRAATVRPTIRRALYLTLLASATVTALLVAGAAPLAHDVLNKDDLMLPLILGALAIVPQNLSVVLAGALAGLQRVGQSEMIYSWLWPTLFCIVAVSLKLAGLLTVSSSLVLIAVSFLLAALVGVVLLRYALAAAPAVQSEDTPTVPQRLLRPGLSLFSLELTKLLITSAPAIVLGIVATDRETGLFALAWRMALVINLLISGVTGMAVPNFAELHARGNTQELERNAAQAIGLVLCLALPAVACLLIFPERLLGLFGHGYGQGVATLRILALGQLAAACFTAMPEMLGMTGRMRALYRINAYTLAMLFIGLAALAPLGASAGAALATSLALATNGAAAARMARRLLGVAPLARLLRDVRYNLRRRPPRNNGKAP